MLRHPTKSSVSAQEQITEEYVQFLAVNAVPKAMSMEEIIKASTDNREIKVLRAALKLNRWDMDTVRPFKASKMNSLSVQTVLYYVNKNYSTTFT